MEKQKIYRSIRLYPDMVAVCTIGPIGDGSDNVIEQYQNATVIYTYDKVIVTDRHHPDTGWATEVEYNTEEIVCITTSKE